MIDPKFACAEPGLCAKNPSKRFRTGAKPFQLLFNYIYFDLDESRDKSFDKSQVLWSQKQTFLERGEKITVCLPTLIEFPSRNRENVNARKFGKLVYPSRPPFIMKTDTYSLQLGTILLTHCPEL